MTNAKLGLSFAPISPITFRVMNIAAVFCFKNTGASTHVTVAVMLNKVEICMRLIRLCETGVLVGSQDKE